MSFEQGHALLIGVSSYPFAPRLDVPIAARDARSLAPILHDPQYCGYPQEKVEVLTESGATRAGILSALDRLAVRTRRDDTVLIFHTGHGEYGTDGSYYLVCHDSKIEDDKVASGSGVSQQELLEKMKAIPAERLLVIFNACHAGEISPAFGARETFGSKSLPGDTAEALLATGSGRVVITACRENQVSYIGKGDLSIFTQALVDGLRGQGVAPRGGYISVFDLYAALFDRVSAVVWDMLGDKQEPELTVLKGVGPMAVALYQGAMQTNLGALGEVAKPPEGKATRVVELDQSVRNYQKISGQSGGIAIGPGGRTEVGGDMIGGDRIDTGGGAYVGGSVSTGGGDFVGRDKTVKGDEVKGDKIVDDNVEGDKIKVGNISGTGIAIGHGASSIVRTGDTFDMSGDFRGAILNINATLENVTQSIGAMPHGDEATKAQLQQLVSRLKAELQRAPADKAEDAEAVADLTQTLVEAAAAEKPNKTIIQITGEGLKQAAQNLAGVMPTVVRIATEIVTLIARTAA